MENCYYKYPNSIYRGKLIKGQAEIDGNDRGVIYFNIKINPYFPLYSKKMFNNNIKSFRKYLLDSFLNPTILNRRLRLSIDSMLKAGYFMNADAIKWPDDSLSFFREFETIYDNVDIEFKINITKKDGDILNHPELHNEFILNVLRAIDYVFLDIQTESDYQFICVPYTLGKMRNENKLKLIHSTKSHVPSIYSTSSDTVKTAINSNKTTV